MIASLTGLANRVLFFDLDRFKVVNDTLGHNVGDVLLTHVAGRLCDSVRHSDFVSRSVDKENNYSFARLGGNESTMLLTNLREVQDAGTVARRIVEAISRPFLIEGREIFVSTSVGIAVFLVDGESVDALLKNADSAMYHAKDKVRITFSSIPAT